MSRKQITAQYFWSTCAATKCASAAEMNKFAGHRKIKNYRFNQNTIKLCGIYPMHM